MNFLIGLGQVFLIIIGIFILGIVINLIMKRGIGTTIGASMMPSQKTLMNAGWMLATYVVCLWAFALIWPTAWEAWWNSQGFWVTQLLFISAIGFLASEWMKTKGLRWLSLIPVAMAILLTTTTVVRNWPESKDASIAKVPETKPSKKIIPKPPFLDTMITLQPKDTIPFKQYDGWTFYTGSGGTSEKPIFYQHQNDGDEWETWGDGKDHGISPGLMVRLTAKDTSVKVRCWYEEN